MASFKRCQRNPTPVFKLLSAALVITFYGLYLLIHGSPLALDSDTSYHHKPSGPYIQHQPWNGASGLADQEKAARVLEAMKHTFGKYKQHAWGYDDILPVSGGKKNTRNGWGAFIVDSASTLALMGLWDELKASVDRIVQIPFYDAQGLVDPFETTIRYVGGLVSLVDLIDAGVIPKTVIDGKKRDGILAQAILLADKLGPGFDSPTGMMYPRVDFKNDVGTGDPPELYKKYPEKIRYKNPSIGPARAGSNILEYRALTRQSGNPTYFANATKAWAPLVWNKWVEDPVGLVSAPIDIFTGEPVGRQRHWDAGHDSYYEYLIKEAIVAPHDRYSNTYIDRWKQAAHAVRHDLATRSSYSDHYNPQHLFMGKLDGSWYLNEMSHLACFAPGNLLLGGSYLAKPDLITLGKALLDGCRHTYTSMPTGIGPERFSWNPYAGLPNGTFEPSTPRQHAELATHGFWLADAKFRLRPEYVESLFYAWRITGEKRYRDWAWDAFVAFEKHCKTKYGFAAIKDVGVDVKKGGKIVHIDEAESFWAAETLKYLYLTFADVKVGTLDGWVFSTEGHPFRIIRAPVTQGP